MVLDKPPPGSGILLGGIAGTPTPTEVVAMPMMKTGSPTYRWFWSKLNPAKKLWVLMGFALIGTKDRVFRICNKHGPFIDYVRGFWPTQRIGDCPDCEKLRRAERLKVLGPQLVKP